MKTTSPRPALSISSAALTLATIALGACSAAPTDLPSDGNGASGVGVETAPKPAVDSAPTVCNSPAHLSQQGGGSRPGPATLIPILWGFLDDQTNRIGQWDAVYQKIESSNYYKWVQSEYGAPALSHIKPQATLYPGKLSGNIQDSDLRTSLATDVRNGGFLNVSNPIYVIHLGPGVTISESNGQSLCKNFYAYNGHYSTFDLLNGGIEEIHYIVVPDPSECGLGFDGVTRVLSHEIAENLTDPEGNGWEDRSQPVATCGVQIADLCNNLPTVINSPYGQVTVQKLWSNALSACVTEDQLTAPTVTSMSPTIGPPGSLVAINGTNFEGTPSVAFGNVAASSVYCTSSTLCFATVPAGQDAVPVTVSLNDFTLQAGSFFYQICNTTTGCGGSVDVQCTPDPAGYPIKVIFSQTGSQSTTLTLPASGWTQLIGAPGTDADVTTCTVTPSGSECATVVVDPSGVSCGGGSPCTSLACECAHNGGTWVGAPRNTCVYPCEPTTCQASGLCGTVSDGCGGTLHCAACPPCVPVDGLCCPQGQSVTSGHCCPDGASWVENRCFTPPPPPVRCGGKLCQ